MTTQTVDRVTHTPGPWDVLDGAVCSKIVNEYGNFIIAECRREHTSEDNANLRLIAAAPETAAERDRLRAINAELLQALKAIERLTCLNYSSLEGYRTNGCAIIREARAALAKAEGA